MAKVRSKIPGPSLRIIIKVVGAMDWAWPWSFRVGIQLDATLSPAASCSPGSIRHDPHIEISQSSRVGKSSRLSGWTSLKMECAGVVAYYPKLCTMFLKPAASMLYQKNTPSVFILEMIGILGLLSWSNHDHQSLQVLVVMGQPTWSCRVLVVVVAQVKVAMEWSWSSWSCRVDIVHCLAKRMRPRACFARIHQCLKPSA